MQDESMGGGGNGTYRGAAHQTFGDTASYGREADLDARTVRDYVGVLWRRKWMILLVIVVATASAYAFSARQAKRYEARADIIYEQQLDISNPLTGQSYTDPTERTLALNSVASVLASPDMMRRADALLSREGVAPSGVKVSAAPVTDAAATGTNVARITVRSSSARVAAAAANAYAQAFIDWRTERVRTQIAGAIRALHRQLDTYSAAARKSTDYLVLQQRLQDMKLLRDTANGNFRMLVPATTPASPVSPKPLRSGLLGFAVGLFAAIGLAFLLEQFDTRLRRPEEVAEILRQPILGRVPRISRRLLVDNGVVTLTEPDGHAADAFRLVRTNLEFTNIDGAVRSLLLTSCEQGEGKSLAVANLAVAMAMAGKKVVIVDGDLRRPRQHTYFHLPNEHGVSTVVTEQTPLYSALQRVELVQEGTGANGVDFATWASGSEAMSRLYVLTSGPLPPNPGEIVASRRLKALIEELGHEADIVLVDSPALLAVGDTAALAASVDGLLFLVDMHRVRRPFLLQAADQLSRLPSRFLGIVLRTDGTHGSYYASRYGYRYASSDDQSRTRPRREASHQGDAAKTPH
jgi:polysaccharide biosynthesis transport protein